MGAIMLPTIIIPTINETTLDQVIKAAKSELPLAEIIVVGFGSSESIANNNGAIFFNIHRKTIKSICINKAVSIAKNPWIIILDADSIPLPGWGDAMLKNFIQVNQIFCGSLDMSYGNFWMKVYNLTSSHEFLPENKPQERKHLAACNLGFTKEIFNLCGGWDESLLRSQDYEWTLRAHSKGVKLWFDPKPSILHVPMQQDSFLQVWRSWERSGFYNWVIRKKYRNLLQTPNLFDHPWLVLVFAPFLALVPTLRILKTSPKNFFKYFYLLPFVYLTKIAWCLGVFKSSKSNQ